MARFSKKQQSQQEGPILVLLLILISSIFFLDTTSIGKFVEIPPACDPGADYTNVPNTDVFVKADLATKKVYLQFGRRLILTDPLPQSEPFPETFKCYTQEVSTFPKSF